MINLSTPLKTDTIKKDVLIVDDSPTYRKMVISAISKFEDFHILEAEDGVDALEKMKKHHIRLIILDYNMPRMNGLEFLQCIKKIDQFKSVPIIMLTTETENKKMVDSYVAGAKVYITKPFKPQELVKVVETMRYWHMK